MYRDFKVNNFDLIRIVTATMVLFNHSLARLELQAPAFYQPFLQFPRVPMFFVMSGYLLSASYERNNNLKHYFTNRLLRIYPALWVCLLVTVALFSLVGAHFFHSKALPWFVSQMAGVIYTPDFLKDFGFGSYNGSLWTIVVELQFYLALPLIYYFAGQFGRKFGKGKNSNLFFYLLFALCFLLSLALKLYFDDGKGESAIEKKFRYTLLPHAFIFLAGILLQRWRICESRYIHGKAVYWIIGYLAFAYLVPGSEVKYMFRVLLLAFCTISVAYSMPGLATRFLKNMDLSYGVFLYHGMLLSILVELNLSGSYYLLIPIVLVSYLLAFLSYRYVEMPAMALAKRTTKSAGLARSKDVPAPAPEPAHQRSTPMEAAKPQFVSGLLQDHTA